MQELRGRRKIYTDETTIDENNVIQVLSDALMEHYSNVAEIDFLMDYEKGIQPINKRKKDIRSEINNKVAVNNASLITTFKIGYEFGSPVTYVQRAKAKKPSNSDPEKDDIRIAALNDMLNEECKAAKDIELVSNFKICGVGYRMIRAKQDVDGCSVFDVLVLNPMTTFVVYSNDAYRQPMMAVSYRKKKTGDIDFACYTKDRLFEISYNPNLLESTIGKHIITNGEGHGVPLVPAIIPIVEFECDHNRQGCFEKVISILDAINIATSDRVNDVAQHVQSLLWMHNCQLPRDKDDNPIDPGPNGLIETTSSQNGVQANIKYLEQPIDQQGVQTLVTDLKASAMEITGVPERQENSGGSTGSAMSLSSGWQMAETIAQTSDLTFDKAEKQCIKIMLEVIKVSNDIPEDYKDIVGLKLSDIDIKHPRNRNFDLNTKVNAFVAMIKAGVNGLDALTVICLFNDPQQVWANSKEMIRKVQEAQAISGKNQETQESKIDGNNANPERTLQDGSDQPQKSNYTI